MLLIVVSFCYDTAVHRETNTNCHSQHLTQHSQWYVRIRRH